MIKQTNLYFLIKGRFFIRDALFYLPFAHFIDKWVHNPILTYGGVILFIIVSFILMILEYFVTSYEKTSTQLVINYGHFIKRRVGIDRTKACLNYRIEQDWLQKWLDVYGMTIFFKNGEEQKEVRFVALTADAVAKLESYLQFLEKDVNQSVQTTVPEVELSHAKLILTGLLSTNCFLIIPIIFNLQDLNQLIEKYTSISIVYSNFWLWLLLASLPIFMISMQYLKFVNFKVRIQENQFIVQNGVLNTDKNIINQADIVGIIIDRQLGLRLLGLCTISILLDQDNGNQTQSKNCLFPLVTEKQKSLLLAQYLPKFQEKRSAHRVQVGLNKLILLLAFVFGAGLISIFIFKISNLWMMLLFIMNVPRLIAPILTVIERDAVLSLIRVKRGMLNLRTVYFAEDAIGVIKQKQVHQHIFSLSIYTNQQPTQKFTEYR